MVHGQQIIEFMIIDGFEAPGAQRRQIYTMRPRGGLRARIRWTAPVVTMGASGIVEYPINKLID